MAGSEKAKSPVRAGAGKHAAVAALTERLGRMRSLVITDYRGLTVSDLQALRGQLREAGVEYLVVKNTLARRASAAAGLGAFAGELTGPTALAIHDEDPGLPARLISEYARTARRPDMIRGGLSEGRLLTAAEVRQLAELPSREVLMAQLLGTLEAPIAQLLSLMESPVQALVGLLEAKAQAAA